MFSVWSVHNQNIWKKLRKATYSEFLTKIFFKCAFLQYIWSLLSQTLHCMKIDRYWHEISMKRILNSVFASFYSMYLDQVYKKWGFWMPNQWIHVQMWRVRTKIKLIVVFWQFFFVSWVRTASKVDLLAIFLLQKILADKVNLSYKAAFKY